jgi:hypothetical protein
VRACFNCGRRLLPKKALAPTLSRPRIMHHRSCDAYVASSGKATQASQLQTAGRA